MNTRTPAARIDRAHPSTPPPPRPLDDGALHELVVGLGPLSEVDSVAGLRARYRDPREHPATGGEQRDAAAALDLAHDRGHLEAHRVAHLRFERLPADVRPTALWVSQRSGAVRQGVPVRVDEWVDAYGALQREDVIDRMKELRRLQADLFTYAAVHQALRVLPAMADLATDEDAAAERAKREAVKARALVAGLKHSFRVRPTPDAAAQIDAANAAEAQACALRELAFAELRAWSRSRLDALWAAWRSL